MSGMKYKGNSDSFVVGASIGQLAGTVHLECAETIITLTKFFLVLQLIQEHFVVLILLIQDVEGLDQQSTDCV
jgi:hypothetical protein